MVCFKSDVCNLSCEQVSAMLGQMEIDTLIQENLQSTTSEKVSRAALKTIILVAGLFGGAFLGVALAQLFSLAVVGVAIMSVVGSGIAFVPTMASVGAVDARFDRRARDRLMSDLMARQETKQGNHITDTSGYSEFSA